MLRSGACEGWVVHRRSRPLQHVFRYPVWMLCVDVDAFTGASPLLSARRRLAPLSLRAQDFPRLESAPRRDVGEPSTASDSVGTIRARLNAVLVADGVAPAEQVFLLTQPRSWGWRFNPVSFYFCYRGGRLANVVAEITNTPWGEVHRYVLAVRDGAESATFCFPKQFHVSPFMPMDVDYHWRVRLDGDTIEIAMRLLRDGRELFFAGLYLRCSEVSPRALRRGAFAYPLQNAVTLARIYWQALVLWCKGAPFHAHPGSTREVRSA